MTRQEDLAHCGEVIKHGSKSFYAASKLLPAKVRDPALALYAFCRLADDAVDLTPAGAVPDGSACAVGSSSVKTSDTDDELRTKKRAVALLRARLDRAYAGRPANDPVERAFTRMVEDTEMPRALPEALIDGLDWDAHGRRYETLSDVRAYSARVASAVGVMMSVLMGVRDRDALARACDLGVAMQLTNIARDIGEDAAENRVYLPLEWFEEMGVDLAAFLSDPHLTPEIAKMAKRLLVEANRLYYRSEAGISVLPRRCRPGIYAARYIYAGIGRHIRAARYDSVTRRARTGLSEKLGLLLLSLGATATTALMPRSPVLYARPLPETRYLVDAAAGSITETSPWGSGAAGTLATAFARLRERDLTMAEAAGRNGPRGAV